MPRPHATAALVVLLTACVVCAVDERPESVLPAVLNASSPLLFRHLALRDSPALTAWRSGPPPSLRDPLKNVYEQHRYAVQRRYKGAIAQTD